MTIARLSSRASADALPLKRENRNMAKTLLDRLRELHCDREPFTSDHAQCVCRLANDAADAIEELRHPFRNADAKDWEMLFRMLPDSGHGQFWKAVMHEAREALARGSSTSDASECVSHYDRAPTDPHHGGKIWNP